MNDQYIYMVIKTAFFNSTKNALFLAHPLTLYVILYSTICQSFLDILVAQNGMRKYLIDKLLL